MSDLQLEFDKSKPISLLYGDNGSGKSTVLDCLSALGHIACMRRLVMDTSGGVRSHASVAREVLIGEYTNLLDAYPEYSDGAGFERCKRSLEVSESVEQWFERSNLGTALFGFSIVPEIDGFNTPVQLFIVFAGTLKQKSISLSQALARERCDDLEMEEVAAVVYSEESAKTLDALMLHLWETSPVIFRIPGHGRTVRRRQRNASALDSLVIAVNTDLNDFGRQNQIRESVKDLRRNFAQEMDERLGVPFEARENGRELAVLNELNNILRNALVREFNGPGAGLQTGTFRIAQCRIDDEGVTSVSVQRGNSISRPVDFMSSGENEVFFIFLLLVGLNASRSIVVLDEPELHIGERSRGQFFRALFRYLTDRDCQVVVATHSLFAFVAPTMTRRQLLQTRELDGELQITAAWDSEYEWAQYNAYWMAGLRFLSAGGVIRPLRSLAVSSWKALETLFKKYPLLMTIVITAISGAALATANDLWSLSIRIWSSFTDAPISTQALGESHLKVVFYPFAVLMCLFLAGVLGVLGLMLFKSVRKRL